MPGNARDPRHGLVGSTGSLLEYWLTLSFSASKFCSHSKCVRCLCRKRFPFSCGDPIKLKGFELQKELLIQLWSKWGIQVVVGGPYKALRRGKTLHHPCCWHALLEWEHFESQLNSEWQGNAAGECPAWKPNAVLLWTRTLRISVLAACGVCRAWPWCWGHSGAEAVPGFRWQWGGVLWFGTAFLEFSPYSFLGALVWLVQLGHWYDWNRCLCCHRFLKNASSSEIKVKKYLAGFNEGEKSFACSVKFCIVSACSFSCLGSLILLPTPPCLFPAQTPAGSGVGLTPCSS